MLVGEGALSPRARGGPCWEEGRAAGRRLGWGVHLLSLGLHLWKPAGLFLRELPRPSYWSWKWLALSVTWT